MELVIRHESGWGITNVSRKSQDLLKTDEGGWMKQNTVVAEDVFNVDGTILEGSEVIVIFHNKEGWTGIVSKIQNKQVRVKQTGIIDEVNINKIINQIKNHGTR